MRTAAFEFYGASYGRASCPFRGSHPRTYSPRSSFDHRLVSSLAPPSLNQEARAEFLARAGQLLATSIADDALLKKITRHCVPFIADYCSIDLLTESGEIRRVETAHVDPAKERIVRDVWTRYPYRASDPFGVPEVIRTGQPQMKTTFSDAQLAGFARDDAHLATLRQLAPKSYIAVPLVARGHTYGALSLMMSESGRRYTSEDLDVARELGQMAATAIDNARLFAMEHAARKEAEHAAERTSRLQRLTAALAVAATPTEAAHAVVTEGIRALSADAGTLWLVTPDEKNIERVAQSGYTEEQLRRWTRIPIDAELPLTHAIRDRTALILGAADQWRSRYPRLGQTSGPSYAALAVAPLLVGDRVVGTLGLSYLENRTFTTADREFLETLAALCAQAVERARLYASEQVARRRAAFLGDASAMLASSLDYETTLRRTAELAVPEVSDWCAVDLVEIDGSLRRVAVAHKDPAKLSLGLSLERRYPSDPDTSLIYKAIRTGESQLIPEITDEMLASGARDPEHLALLRAIGFTSVMVVPLIARGRTLGAMTFVASTANRTHGADDLALAETLGQRAAVAVDNARLFRAAEEARQRADEARDAAEKANQAKSDFLATMSHEIRTPVNAVIGYAQLLEMGIAGPLSAEQRLQLGRIATSAGHLSGLINDILDLARVEAGRLTVAMRECSAGGAVDAALTLVRPQAASKGIAMSSSCEGEREARYVGDEQRVEQILVNLLSNAIKFTPPGGRVQVRCASRTAPPEGLGLVGEGWTSFSVEDSGIGIAPDRVEAVFQPFTQADTGYTRQHSGSGLGLTISRQLARLMGGEITVESTPGKGSTFTLWLPKSEDLLRTAEREARSNTDVVEWSVLQAEMQAGGAGRSYESIGRSLQSQSARVIRLFLERMRAELAVPHLAKITDAQLEDHFHTYLSDIAQALIIVHTAQGEPSALLRDGTDIQRMISERHGLQRHRLGWTEIDLRQEFGLLREVILDALPRDSGSDRQPVTAREILGALVRHAEQVSVRALQLAAQSGPPESSSG